MPVDVLNDRLINSKVVVLFQSLSKKELRQFSKYLEGTPYKKENDIYSLFNYLKKHYPNFCEKKINKQAVCNHVYKDGVEGKFLQLCTNLTKVLEDFLIKLELEEGETERNFMLLKALKRRKLDNLFFQNVKKVRKQWETNKPAGIEQLHNQYLLESLYYNYIETPNIEKIINAMIVQSESLDNYYIALRLHLSNCIYYSKNYVNNKTLSVQNNIVKTILNISSSKKYQNIPQIKLLASILTSLANFNYENFSQIRNDFFKTFHLFNKAEQNDIMNSLLHFCQENHKKGAQDAKFHLFELTKWAVDNKFYIDNGYFDNMQFQNIVNIAINAKESNWALMFIENYNMLLLEDIREDIVAYCKVICLLRLKKYEEILEVLLTIKFRNISIGLNSRCIQMRAYIELNGRDDEFYKLCRSFKAVVDRDNLLSENRKEPILNFIQYSKFIYDLRYNKKNNLFEIEQKIKQLKHLYFRKWLLQKLSLYK